MRTLIAAAALLLAACASAGAPPGGPIHTTPPELVDITPDSGTVGVAPPSVVFRFNRVVAERPQGANDLAGLVLISPSDGLPRVSWNRSAIAVRPRRAWQPNTVYTVTLLPGIADLQGNVLSERTTVVFATGREIPDTRIDGIIFDWLAGRPAPNAAVEARSLPDSTLYITRADSAGRFTFQHLPRGTFEVLGFVDGNRNRQLDLREPWDTAGVVLTDSARVELLAFVHDTLPPAIARIDAVDSMTLRVSFERAILPELELVPAMFRVNDEDSAEVPVASVMRAAEWEARRAEADTSDAPARPAPTPAPPRPGALPPARRPAPATPAPPPIEPSRPAPSTGVIVTLQRPIAGGVAYRVQATGILGLLRTEAVTERTFTAPRAQEVPATPDEEETEDPPPPGAHAGD